MSGSMSYTQYMHSDCIRKQSICLQCMRPWFNSWVGKISWRRDRLPTPVILSFPGGSDNKESAFSAGDLGSVPGLGRSPAGGNGNPLQDSCLESPYGQRILAGYSPGGLQELDVTEWLSTVISNEWMDEWKYKYIKWVNNARTWSVSNYTKAASTEGNKEWL